MKNKNSYGFTLMELTIVLVILSVLFAIIYAVLNPAIRFAQARNGQRWGEVNGMIQAVILFRADHGGDFPKGITNEWQVLGTATKGCNICGSDKNSCLDISGYLVKEYLGVMPFDPRFGSEDNTYYAIRKTEEENVMVKACLAELNENIELIR